MFARSVSLFRSIKQQGAFLMASVATSCILLPLIHLLPYKVSDRRSKERIEPINSSEILKQLSTLPLSTWTYRGAPMVQHIGPMAQDFARFGLGDKNTRIWDVDAHGVAFAALQALYAQTQAQQLELQALQAKVMALTAGCAPANTDPPC